MRGRFISVLAERIESFVAERSRLGYRPSCQMTIYRKFDRFVADRMHAPGPITREVVEGYVVAIKAGGPFLRDQGWTPIRELLKYLRRFDAATFVPDEVHRIVPVEHRNRFRSCLGAHLSAFIELRFAMGYRLSTYLFVYELFDRVADREMQTSGPVTREVVEAFLRSMSHLRSNTRQMRLTIIRQFLRYLRQHEPATYIPDRFIEPSHGSPRRPYIFADREVKALIQAAHYYGRVQGSRWILYPTLFGLLATTGMRVSEALDLTVGDVDLKDAVIHVRKAKFQKARLVPLAGSTCSAVQRYLVARAERGFPTTPEAPLFPAERVRGGRLPYSTAKHAFHALLRSTGLNRAAGGRRPRIHDLRHTVAVRRLCLWYREGSDVQALIPSLVTYLGHSSVQGTAKYLTTTAELLAEASRRQDAFLGSHVSKGDAR